MVKAKSFVIEENAFLVPGRGRGESKDDHGLHLDTVSRLNTYQVHI
jgi:hypothetical protein